MSIKTNAIIFLLSSGIAMIIGKHLIGIWILLLFITIELKELIDK